MNEILINEGLYGNVNTYYTSSINTLGTLSNEAKWSDAIRCKCDKIEKLEKENEDLRKRLNQLTTMVLNLYKEKQSKQNEECK